MMKSYSVFHIEQKTEFEKFNCFFVKFLRSSFGRIKVIRFCFAYQLTGFYMIRGFTKWYFLAVYSYILENQFYLFYFYFVSSITKVLRPNYFPQHRFARSLFTERKKKVL